MTRIPKSSTREFCKRPQRKPRLARGALAFALLTATTGASGQVVAPSRVTPTTLAPPSGPSGAIAVTSPEGLTAPANASKLFLTIGNVTVEGGFPELAADTAAITAKIQGRRISVAEIFAAANAIEQAYAARGYVLVRVAVPPQQLKNGGTLRLVVIDGFIEGADLKGIPEKQRALVQARLASLIGKRHVTLAEIERRLLLASDIPGLSLSSTITRGTAPGATLLVLEGTWNAVVGTLGVDNRLPTSLGDWELNGALAVNSPLGYGEQIYGAASSGWDLGKVFNATTPMQLLGAGIVAPIGVDGWKINPEYTNSVTRPAPTPWAPADVGYYQRFDLRASYPLILSRPDPDVPGDLRVGPGASVADRVRHGPLRRPVQRREAPARGPPPAALRIASGNAHLLSRARRSRRNPGGSDRGSALAAGGVPDLQQARAGGDLDPAPALRFAGRPDRSGPDQLRPPTLHRRAVLARWLAGGVRLPAWHLQRRRRSDPPRRNPAAVGIRLEPVAGHGRPVCFRGRLARVDRRPDRGAARPYQRRIGRPRAAHRR